jgi:hypothetical protein
VEKPIVAISPKTLLRAERRISGCSNCTDRVSTRFERLLDAITGQRETTMYVLPAQAICPVCHHGVIESTMVLLREDAPNLIITTRDDIEVPRRNRSAGRTKRRKAS